MSALAGQHAVVTGAGRGIGAAIVRTLVDAGASVTLIGRTQRTLDVLAEQLPLNAAFATAADVTDMTSIYSALGKAREKLGTVSILINNAGQARSAPVDRTDDVLWDQMLNVNLTGAFRCIRAALPDLVKCGSGRIVNVASTAGLIGYPYVAAYCAAKHGVVGLTRSLALELVKKNITVNAVCPGYTDTDIVRESIENVHLRTGRSVEEARAAFVGRNPQGRLVRPDEVANAVLWLCLPSSGSITGQSIAVAGGEVM